MSSPLLAMATSSALHCVRAQKPNGVAERDMAGTGSDEAMKTASPGPGRQFEYALLATPTELWSVESPAAGGPVQRLTRIAYGTW